jgi:hypothetical protein
VYPNDEVARLIGDRFVPVKIHIKEQPQTFERFRAQWTPTIVVLDGDGVEHHRFEGFLPTDDFRAQLELGLARAAFDQKRWDEAERQFRSLSDARRSDGDVGAEALYWSGVSAYKGRNDASALKRVAAELRERAPESVWTKKASVWLGEEKSPKDRSAPPREPAMAD